MSISTQPATQTVFEDELCKEAVIEKHGMRSFLEERGLLPSHINLFVGEDRERAQRGGSAELTPRGFAR